MLERDATYNDILDRIEALEARIEDLRDMARPTEVVVVEQGEWQAIAGWISTGTVLRSLGGEIVLDPTVPRIRIDADGYIESADFSAGVSGFQINGGVAEFNNVTVRGTIVAAAGSIAGWTIDTGHLYAGSGGNRAGLRPADYPFYAGNETPGSAPFRVTPAGALVATSATITGAITANTGTLVDLNISGLITVGAASPRIEIDGTNQRIQSSTFQSGYAGMQITATGDAEFNNVRVRGAISSTVFVKGLVEAQAGSLIVVKSGGVLAADMVVPGSGGWYMYIEDPPGGGYLFADSDICRCKSECSAGIADIWFTLSSRTDMGNGTQRYTCTYQSGTRSITYPSGAPVLDYGVSGGGGLLLTADATGAPFLSVFTHAGSPWSALTERGRFGNLNGVYGYSADAYGLAVGEYAANKANMTWDPTNGLRLRTYATTVIQLDQSGNADITGKLRLPGSSSAIAIGATPPTAANAGTGIWIDRTGLYGLNSNVVQAKINSSGQITAGADKVGLLANGLRLLPDTVWDPTSGSSISWAATLTGTPLGSISTWRLTNPEMQTMVTIGAGVTEAASPQAKIQLFAAEGGGHYVNLTATTVIATGDLRVTGTLKSRKSSVDYDVFAFYPLTTPITHTSFNNTTYSTVSSATKIENTSWSSTIPASAKALLVQISARESAAVGTTGLYVRLGGSSTYPISLIAHMHGGDLWTDAMGPVPCTDGDIWYQIAASGSNTTRVYLRVWGYWI